MTLHGDQADVSADTVRLLVEDQLPQWAGPVEQLSTTGTVHSIFRLADLALRFPLRKTDPAQARAVLEAEALAAAEFADVSPFPAPVPVAIGSPGHGYPMPWSVQTWVQGDDALIVDPAGSLAFADDLATLIAALRRVDTGGRTFGGSGRGGDLPDHDAWIATCLDRSEGLLDVPRLRTAWNELRSLPSVDEDAMTHGDLTPGNVLVHDGRLVGVLDTGGFGAADPALDLVSVWHLLEDAGRDHVRRTLVCSDVQWKRGMAWALQQGLGLVWYYEQSNPRMAAWGRRTLERILLASER